MSLDRLGIIKEIAEPVRREFVKVPNDKVNINHWTDASKYADEYYGETMRETTRFDNEWN